LSIQLDNYIKTVSPETTPARFDFASRQQVDLEHWQQDLRAALYDAMGMAHLETRRVASPKARVVEQVELEDHLREDWRLETEHGFELPFFLLKPLDGNENAPRPLVLTPHGHSSNGRQIYAGIASTQEDRALMFEGQRDIALQAVRAGYIAIAPEVRGFGDSRGPTAITEGKPWVCEDWQRRALLLGRTMIAERVWDLSRLIDWSETQPQIDGSRIAITGNSGGGTLSVFAAAMETRIRVSVPGSYFCTFADSIASIHHCLCNFIPGLLSLAEMSDVAGLIAPRPFLAVNGVSDPIFPVEATRRSFEKLKQIYDHAGATDRCQLHIGDGGHRFYKEPVWQFLQQWL